ncbi:hypothetical protein ACH5RR_026435 [Cinchona calisaya]|uniref:Uncharacterized protein n=1 Tax=Cinchona calisaya TaxID=153742 RepID=A0ABD2Z2J8_9GENT
MEMMGLGDDSDPNFDDSKGDKALDSGSGSDQQDVNMGQGLNGAAGLSEGSNINITNNDGGLFEIVLEQDMFEDQEQNEESNPEKVNL